MIRVVTEENQRKNVAEERKKSQKNTGKKLSGKTSMVGGVPLRADSLMGKLRAGSAVIRVRFPVGPPKKGIYV